MIGLLLLSVLQAVAEPAPAPQLRRDERTIVAPNSQFWFPDEIAPMMFEYLNCLNPREGLRSEGTAGFGTAFRARIQACRPTRDWAISSAVSVYKRDRKKPGGPREQLAKIFDDVEAAQVRSSEYVDAQFRAQMGLPADSGTAVKTDATKDQ